MTENPSQINDTDLLKYQVLLKSIDKFIRTHKDITYVEFDYFVVHELTLFSITHNLNLKNIERQVEEIVKSLSSIINIFNNPTIVLKDNADVLPVENAKVINQNTLIHLANHSHLLSTETNKGLKPKKLLTRVYEDDYSLYENLIFCNLIDEIMDLVRKSRNYLSGLLYAERLLEFNLIEQVNHRSYFLALGKLHTGYVRNHSQNLDIVHKLLDKSQLILQTITPLLSRPVYQKNLKRDKFMALKKTNIFLMQKDYRRIYKTFRFLRDDDNSSTTNVKIKHAELRRNYMRYALILTLFAVGHFNFVTDPKSIIDLKSLDVKFTFKDWVITIENTKQHEIILRFTKDKSYSIMLLDTVEDDDKTMKKRRKYKINEMIYISQLYESYLTRDYVYVSIEDIDSFRRIQQIILKGMITVDESHRFCPFCGGKLTRDEQNNQYTCRSCKTEIGHDFCPTKKKDYHYTDCTSLRHHVFESDDEMRVDDWTLQKQIEASFYFRNITKIDEQGHIICPHCQKSHLG